MPPAGVGRIVHYVPADQKEASNSAPFHPAIITRVWSDTCINIKVLPDCAAPFDRTSVSFGDARAVVEPGKVYWPPGVS